MNPLPPHWEVLPLLGNCEHQTPFLGSQMPNNPVFIAVLLICLRFIDVHSKIKALCVSAGHRQAPVMNRLIHRRWSHLSVPSVGSKQSSYQLRISVHRAGASCMRNSSSAFKYIWYEPTWSLWHHTSPQGKDLLALESNIPWVHPSLGGR